MQHGPCSFRPPAPRPGPRDGAGWYPRHATPPHPCTKLTPVHRTLQHSPPRGINPGHASSLLLRYHVAARMHDVPIQHDLPFCGARRAAPGRTRPRVRAAPPAARPGRLLFSSLGGPGPILARRPGRSDAWRVSLPYRCQGAPACTLKALLARARLHCTGRVLQGAPGPRVQLTCGRGRARRRLAVGGFDSSFQTTARAPHPTAVPRESPGR
jgi:hypothetical protein